MKISKFEKATREFCKEEGISFKGSNLYYDVMFFEIDSDSMEDIPDGNLFILWDVAGSYGFADERKRAEEEMIRRNIKTT